MQNDINRLQCCKNVASSMERQVNYFVVPKFGLEQEARVIDDDSSFCLQNNDHGSRGDSFSFYRLLIYMEEIILLVLYKSFSGQWL